jgi:hyperosmotically inducible periplasmic protein
MEKGVAKSKLDCSTGKTSWALTTSGRRNMKKIMKHIALGLLATTVTVATITTTGCSNSPYKRSSGEYLDDQTLTARVKSALFSDPNVSGFQVNVDSYKGTVSLSGFVDTAAQKARAEDVARQVNGVRQVQNNLSVRENVNSTTTR